MLSSEGRKVTDLDQAERFIRSFINIMLHPDEELAYGKSYDFDLYLPQMMDWVLNIPGEKEEHYSPTDFLERLYMEAGWDLCQKGLLRPGPRSTISESPGDAYGKGYSLTAKGMEWLKGDDQPKPDQSQPSR